MKMKELFQNLRRKTAMLLVTVFFMQTALSGGNFLAAAATSPRASNEIDLKAQGAGSPNEMFEYIYAKMGSTVSGDQFDRLSMYFGFALLDGEIGKQLEKYVSEGILTSLVDFTGTSAEYDAYLMEEQKQNSIEVPSFTCVLNNGVIDTQKVMAWLNTGKNSEIITGSGEKIGTWSLKETADGPQFTIQLDAIIFNRQNVWAFFGTELNLLNQYKEGSTVDAGKGSGNINIEVKVNGEGLPVATDSNYIVSKELREGLAEEDSIFVYQIKAGAVEDTGRLRLATDSLTAISTASEEKSEDWEDGDIINDLFSVPMESFYLRSALSETATTNNLRAELDLTGKKITDTLPEGLELLKVRISWDGGTTFEDLAGWENDYNEDTRLFEYSIENEEGSPVTQCDLLLYTGLTDDLWKQYYMDNKLEKEFSNRAWLWEGEDGSILNYSNPVDSEINWDNMLKKEGNPVDSTNQKFEWSITMEGHFSPGVQLYLTDHIANIENTHNYIWDEEKKMKINVGGNSQTVTQFVLMEDDIQEIGAENLKFDGEAGTPSIDTIEKLLERKGLSYNSGIHYGYEYETENGQRDAVLLLSAKDFANSETKITYETKITAKGDDTTGEFETEIANDINAVLKWLSGEGPGDGPWGPFTVRKNTNVKIELAKKKPGGYSEVNNTIQWDFELNQSGREMKWLRMEDKLPDGLEWEIVSGSLNIAYIDSNTGQAETTTLPEKSWAEDWDSDLKNNYYSVNQSEGNNTIRIHLADVTANQYYQFSLTSKIMEKAFAPQNKNLEFKNEGKVTAKIGDNEPVEKTISASRTVENELVKKAVEPFKYDGKEYLYDYEHNQVQWKITMNPKKLTITDAVLIDTMPEGTESPALVSVTRDGVPATKVEGTKFSFDNRAIEGKVEGRKLTFVFPSPIQETYEFIFTTKVTDQHRKETFKSNENTKLKNQVHLDGKIAGVTITGADAEAVNSFPPQPLLKTGKFVNVPTTGTNLKFDVYDGEVSSEKEIAAAYVNWTVYINRTKADFSGVTISDTVEDIFELLPTTMVISEVELDAQGKESADKTAILYSKPNPQKPKPIDPNKTALKDLILNEQGFSFVIPSEYAAKTLKLEFKTILVDDAAKAIMTNQIKAVGTDWEDQSGDVKADAAEDFRLSSYANASGMIFLQILKESSQANQGEAIYLEGAKFELQELKLKAGGFSSTIGDWEDNEKFEPKEKTTNALGKVAFMFLKTDVVYRVREVESPVGYVKDHKTWYVVIVGAQDKDYFPAEAEDVDDGNKGTYDVTIQTRANYLTEEIDNTPNNSGNTGNGFKIKKTGQNEQLLKDVVFTLSYKGNQWTAQTDDGGIAEFEKLNPLPSGEFYTLTEAAPLGYKPGAEHRVEVTAERGEDGTDTYAVAVKRKEAGQWVTATKEGNAFLVSNTPEEKSASFTKVNQYGETLTDPAVTFQLFRKGDGGSGNSPYTVNINPSGEEYKSYLPLPSVTTENGIVRLPNLYYGYYKLEEQSQTEDSIIETAAEPVYFQVRKEGVFARDKNGQYNLSMNNSQDFKVVNKIKAGTVQVRKVAGDQAGDSGHGITKPLEGISFIITKKGETTPYLTLRTDTTGNFTQNSDGSYTDSEIGVKKSLFMGEYTLKEKEAPQGLKAYTGEISFQVTPDNWNKTQVVSFDGKTPSVAIHSAGEMPGFYNLPVRGALSLTKSDQDTGTSLDGAVFVVYEDERATSPVAFVAQQRAGEPYRVAGGQWLDQLKARFPQIRLKASVNGIAPFSGNDTDGYRLAYGVYYIKEVKAPYGYQLSDTIDRLSINQEQNGITIGNQLGFSGFMLEKTVEVLGADLKESASPELGIEFEFEITGTDKAGGSKKPIHSLDSLRIDGKTLASASNAQATRDGIKVKTGADGKVEITGLLVGDYQVKEVGGPNYQRYTETAVKTVSITQPDDGNQFVVSEPVVRFYNQWKRRDITGMKRDQDGAPLKGAEFGLYSEDGSTLYQTVTSADNGVFRFDKIPVGRYLVKEVRAPLGYKMSSGEGILAVVNGAGSEAVRIDRDVINTVMRGTITGQKNNSSGQGLAGATIGLFAESTTSFTEGNLFRGMTAISGQDGSFLFEQVPYGTYRIAELKAPSGYRLNGATSYKVTITEDGSLVNVGMKEERLNGVSTEPEAIVIVNTKNSGGGVNGGGGTPPRPVDPTAPTNPGPGVPPTEPGVPTAPEIPTQSESPIPPGDPIQPPIPFDPENPVIDVPGLPPRVEIHNPNGDKVYDGAGSGVNIGGWEPGVYEVFLFDEHGVPLASMWLTIDEYGIPLSFSLPKTGDSSVPIAVPLAVLFGSAVGIWAIRRRKKEEGA